MRVYILWHRFRGFCVWTNGQVSYARCVDIRTVRQMADGVYVCVAGRDAVWVCGRADCACVGSAGEVPGELDATSRQGQGGRSCCPLLRRSGPHRSFVGMLRACFACVNATVTHYLALMGHSFSMARARSPSRSCPSACRTRGRRRANSQCRRLWSQWS